MAIAQFLFDIFEEFSNRNLNIELWFRTHPGQSLDGIDDLITYYHLKVNVNGVMSTEEFIENSDILVSWDTTAIIWAMIFGKPLFYTNPWWGEGYFPVRQYKAGWIATSAKELVSDIIRLIQNPSRANRLRVGQKKFLEDVVGVLDGTSAEKHIALLKKLLHK